MVILKNTSHCLLHSNDKRLHKFEFSVDTLQYVFFIYPACFGTEQIQLNYVTAFVMGIRDNKIILRNRNKVISALTKMYPKV